MHSKYATSNLKMGEIGKPISISVIMIDFYQTYLLYLYLRALYSIDMVYTSTNIGERVRYKMFGCMFCKPLKIISRV